jgi:hypothetical protein
MKYRNTFVACICLFLVWNISGSSAQKNIYLPMNASRIRALGMGAAYQAARDDLAAISYNPAGYTLYEEAKNFRLTLFLSPVMPALVGSDSKAFFNRNVENRETVYAAIISSIKGINFTYKNLDLGILLGEPSIVDTTLITYRKNPFHVKSLYRNHYDAVVLRIKLAEQVAIGVSGFLNYFETDGRGREWDFAASYGITLQPSNYMRVGVSLFTATAKRGHSREFLDEIYSDAVNLGVTFIAPWQFVFGLDIRNLAVSQEVIGERYLAGFENSFWQQVAIRAGLPSHPEDKSLAQPFGFGIVNLNSIWGENRRFKQNNYAVNYVLIRKKIVGADYNIHAFNLSFRF